LHSEEAAGERGGDAARARDGGEQGMAVRNVEDSLAVRNVVDGPGHRGDKAQLPRRTKGERRRLETRGHRLDAAHLRLGAGERRDFALVAAQIGDTDLVEDPPRRVGPVSRGAGADRVEDDRDPSRARRATGEEHRLDQVLRERADVAHVVSTEPDTYTCSLQ